MARRCLKGGAAALAVVAGLLLGQWGARFVLSGRTGYSQAASSAPMVELPYAERDFGTVRQGVMLEASFPVRNAGARRLILLEQSRACCGQSADQAQTVVPPGDSRELRLRVDTSRWSGQVREVVRYTTNDPNLPRFALTLSAQVASSAEGDGEAEPDSRAPPLPLP